MDQFSHDLTIALEETSLMVRACGVSRWGTRRRTRSTGNLPCAPQPTEDSSSSPTDIIANAHNNQHHTASVGGAGVQPSSSSSLQTSSHAIKSNLDGLAMHINPTLPASDDSDEKHQSALPLRLPCKSSLNAAVRLGTLESDSLNETNFSPIRFYKPSSRKKRKIKRMSMEFDLITNSSNVPNSYTESPSSSAAGAALQPSVLSSNLTSSLVLADGRHMAADTKLPSSTGTVRKRLLKHEANANANANTRDTSNRSHHNIFFCGKRKRSNRDRYQEHHEHHGGMMAAARQAAHYHQVSFSMPRHHHQHHLHHHVNIDEYRSMRPRSFSSTSKPHSDRLLPLNKGLVSKIERISSQLQKTDNANKSSIKPDIIMTTNNIQKTTTTKTSDNESSGTKALNVVESIVPIVADVETALLMNPETKTTGQQSQQQQSIMLQVLKEQDLQQPFLGYYRKKTTHHMKGGMGMQGAHNHPPSSIVALSAGGTGGGVGGSTKTARNRTRRAQKLKFGFLAEDLQQAMDCSDLNDFLSSSSLSSSSDSEDDHHHHRPNDTDREGDDELTDWPGNYEFGGGGIGGGGVNFKFDPKRKLTKKSTLPQIRSDDTLGGEDDTLMSGPEIGGPVPLSLSMAASSCIDVLPNLSSSLDMATMATSETTTPTPRFQASEPIRIATQRNTDYRVVANNNADDDDDMSFDMICGGTDGEPILKQIESEMSGETSNPFLSSSPVLSTEVREIRAGCRRIKVERPGFSIKLGVNERLARFLQDPRQTQIRLPDIEIYEHDSLLNLATLYSLEMTLENGCAVLNKTSNTTQTVSIDQQQQHQQHNFHNHRHSMFFSDFKRRCYDDGKGSSLLPRK